MLYQTFVLLLEVDPLLLELGFKHLVGLGGHPGVLDAEQVGLFQPVQQLDDLVGFREVHLLLVL